MPGPFDLPQMPGAGSPFDMNGYQKQMLWDSLTNAGLGLLQASSPSPYPQDFGTVFGGLAGGVARGAANSEDKYLKRALTGAQVATAQQKIQQGNDWRDLIKGASTGGTTPTSSGIPQPGWNKEVSPGSLQGATPAVATSGASPNPFNIGNVRPVGGGPTSGFQQPADFDSGVLLAVNNAKAYPGTFNNGQPVTLLQIGERWAPKGDGKNDPVQWARNVSSLSGLPVDQPIDLSKPDTAAAFARGVHGAEWGAGAVRPIGDYTRALSRPAPMPQGGAAPPLAGDQGDSLQPTPVQYTPGQQQPKSFAQIVQSVPPGVRQMIAVMGPEAGMKELLKYADPETVPAIDVRSGQVVFAPKTELGNGTYQPIDAARLGLDREKFDFDKEKFNTEQKSKGQFVRGQDGVQRWVPADHYKPGMPQYEEAPKPGTEAGDVGLLKKGQDNPDFVNTPEYAGAYNRAAKPTMSQSGQIMHPDMSAYPKPGGVTSSGGPRFEDTASSRFQMAGKLADDFNQLKPVKDAREVAPIFQSMKEAAGRNNRVADLNLVYGLAKIMDPTSVVREGEQIMVRNAQSLPDWLRGYISAVNGGSGFPPEQRARIMKEAESRVAAYQAQYDAVAQQFTERAQRYGLDPRDVLTAPAAPGANNGGPAQQGGANFDYVPGKGLVRP